MSEYIAKARAIMREQGCSWTEACGILGRRGADVRRRKRDRKAAAEEHVRQITKRKLR